MPALNEIWRPVVGWEGCYEVSNFGRIRSLDRIVQHSGNNRRLKGKILSGNISKGGYKQVSLYADGFEKKISIHRLVGLAFIDTYWTGPFDHIDCDKLNNIVTNIRTSTISGNGGNMKKREGLSSKYKGVSFYNSSKKNPWQAHLCHKQLGVFPTQEQAALAYNRAAIKYFKEFARLNEL